MNRKYYKPALCMFMFFIILISFTDSTIDISLSMIANEDIYLKAREITIDHNLVQDDIPNFPLLFTTIDSDFSVCQTDGDDIVFYDKMGEIKLDHEIEFFDQSSSELVAWVKIPFLSSTEDTIIQMLFGKPYAINTEKPSGVWEDYDGVYHLSNFIDSKGINDLTKEGSVIPDTDGKFATAQMFDGYGNDYLKTNTNFDITNSFSIECWIKIDGSDLDQTFVTLPHSSTGVAQRLMLNWSDDIALARNYQASDQGINTFGSSSINDGSWHYLVHTYDNEYNRLYVDGQLEGSDAYSGIVRCFANEFYIGREGSNSETGWPDTVMSGSIDEVSVSRNVFSDSRIITEFNNQKHPSEFYSIKSTTPIINYKPFKYNVSINIDHTQVQEDLVNFPFVFASTYNDLSICQADGDDIVFYDEQFTQQLHHEIEFFDQSSGELVAWVKIPFLSSTEDTIIQMLFGKPSAINSETPSNIWEEYAGVYHLSHLKDSKGINDLIQTGSVIPDTHGKFSTAQKFDGYGNDYLKTNTNFDIINSFSIECWIKIDGSDLDQTFITLPHSSTGVAQRLMLNWSDDIALARNYQASDQGINTFGSSTINDDSWHYLVHTYDNEYNKLYVDGQLEGSDAYSGVVRCFANEFYIGREGSNSETGWPETVMNGLIDEVSVSRNVFSPARILTEYNNQNNPSEFYSIDGFTSMPSLTPGFLPLISLTGLFCILIIIRRKK